MRTYWLSCSKLTCAFDVNDNDIVIKAAPILRKFCGQPKENLLRWVQNRFGDYLLRELKGDFGGN